MVLVFLFKSCLYSKNTFLPLIFEASIQEQLLVVTVITIFVLKTRRKYKPFGLYNFFFKIWNPKFIFSLNLELKILQKWIFSNFSLKMQFSYVKFVFRIILVFLWFTYWLHSPKILISWKLSHQNLKFFTVAIGHLDMTSLKKLWNII